MNRTLKAIVSLMLMMVFAVGCTKPDEPEPEPQTIVAPEGAVDGLFSVSENTKVYFSRGNLQHQPSTHTWRFADEQYDYLERYDQMDEYYDGWIDAFGWGTSGYNGKSHVRSSFFRYGKY